MLLLGAGAGDVAAGIVVVRSRLPQMISLLVQARGAAAGVQGRRCLLLRRELPLVGRGADDVG